MSMELPVVTSDICGIHELVDNGHSGILTSPKDPYAIANAIEKLFMSDCLRNRLGKAARKKILNHFNIKTEVKKLESIFEKAVL